MFNVEYRLFDKLCTYNFIQNTDILITKDLSAQSFTITLKVFYINFDLAN